MKKNFKVILFSVLMLAAFQVTAVYAAENSCGQKIEISSAQMAEVKPITGSWINLAYKDVRNKYTNPRNFDNTDPDLWEAKVRELSDMGIEYLVFMEVANEGKAYYPSRLMPWWYDRHKKSPVEAILDEAAKHHIKVFMSTGWAKSQDDNLLDPAIRERQLLIMEELASLFKGHKAFYGWYLPVEDCLCPILAEHAVQSVNTLTMKAKSLTPDKKILISPYGIGLSDFDNPEYEKQLAKLKVDIIAYQDEVGCVRERFPLPRLKRNWQRLRDIHNRLNIEMWANCETFTWEEGTNDRTSALIPAAYPRLLSQQVAASAGGVDRIISFMYCGIVENPESKFQLGQPLWSNKMHRDYMNWKKGMEYWKLSEAALMGRLGNGATPKMIQGDTRYQALLDGKVAEEDTADARWVKFGKGYHELIINLQKKTNVRKAMLRLLDYNQGGIGMPEKVYLFTSSDGETYHLSSVKDASHYPNNRHDAWIESILFEQLDENIRFIKVAFEAPQEVYMDELFINPSVIEGTGFMDYDNEVSDLASYANFEVKQNCKYRIVGKGFKIPKVIAHRGFHNSDNKIPQNSLASFKAAQKLGVYGSEADFYITKDNVVVCHHDPTIDGIKIEDANYADIRDKQLANGEKIPTLDAYLEQLKKGPEMKLILEIKSHNSNARHDKIIEAITKMVRENGVSNRVDYIAFSYYVCQKLIQSVPSGTIIGYLNSDKDPKDMEDGINCIDYYMNNLKNNPQWIKNAYEKGMTVNVWTVNSLQEMQDFMTMGVDFITTDHPDQLKEIIAKSAD